MFVCASTEAKIQRCMERAAEDEQLSRKEVEQNIHRIDKARAQTHEMISGSEWRQASAYHLIVNTTGWKIKDLTPAVS